MSLWISCCLVLVAFSLRKSCRDKKPCASRPRFTFLCLLMDLSDLLQWWDTCICFPDPSGARGHFWNSELKNLIEDSFTSSEELSCAPISASLASKLPLFGRRLSISAAWLLASHVIEQQWVHTSLKFLHILSLSDSSILYTFDLGTFERLIYWHEWFFGASREFHRQSTKGLKPIFVICHTTFPIMCCGHCPLPTS